MQYLSSGSSRAAVHVFYWGQIWADRDVPWHYPWVMFAVTVPIGLLALGVYGFLGELIACRSAGKSSGTVAGNLPGSATSSAARDNLFLNGDGMLVLGTMTFLLLVFSWPGTPVYDGARLFLMVFPLAAIWVGVGARQLVLRYGGDASISDASNDRCASEERTARLRRRTVVAIVVALIALQAVGLAVYRPCYLSYYNLLVGGLAGAERLGFEATYWGDSIDESMLAEGVALSAGRPILFAPSLAPFQPPAVAMSSPSISISGGELIGFDSSAPVAARRCRYAVVYNRQADPVAAVPMIARGKVVSERSKQGVWLSRLVELDFVGE